MPTLFVLVILGIWALAVSNAKAALQPGCTQTGTTVTCSYSTQGQQASFTVPAGVASLGVYAVGGSGGYTNTVRRPQGAPSAIVTGTLGVSPGSILSIQVAGDGTSGTGGAGGGGAGCMGGGGASKVSAASGPLVVAAGGGGDGCYGAGGGGSTLALVPGYGGAAGSAGQTGSYGNAGGGLAGTQTAGGAGGAGDTGIFSGNSGAAGSAGTGGAGGNGASRAGAPGGGGGGGLYGGGGGGQGAYQIVEGIPTGQPGGGGGGGSSLVPPGGSLRVQSMLMPLPSPPMVAISYNVPPSAGTPSVPVRLTGVGQSHARWRRGAKLPQLATIARVRKPPVGTAFRFTLSGAAAVRFAFTQSPSGRRVGGRCVGQTAKNRRKRACRRTVTVGSFGFSAGAGRYAVGFQGRISRLKKLEPGRYTLVITATNTAGSTSGRLKFTIAS